MSQRYKEMTTEIESWKQEPVSPDWLEIDDWTDYGDTTLLEDIDFIIKDGKFSLYIIIYLKNNCKDVVNNIQINNLAILVMCLLVTRKIKQTVLSQRVHIYVQHSLRRTKRN